MGAGAEAPPHFDLDFPGFVEQVLVAAEAQQAVRFDIESEYDFEWTCLTSQGVGAAAARRPHMQHNRRRKRRDPGLGGAGASPGCWLCADCGFTVPQAA